MTGEGPPVTPAQLAKLEADLLAAIKAHDSEYVAELRAEIAELRSQLDRVSKRRAKPATKPTSKRDAPPPDDDDDDDGEESDDDDFDADY